MIVLPELQDSLPEMVALRRQIHANPELGFEEHQTAALVADRLQGWGYEVHREVGGTGVVATLSAGSGHRRLGLRADLDALPITETTGLPYASRIATSTVPCTWCSNPLKKAWAVHSACWTRACLNGFPVIACTPFTTRRVKRPGCWVFAAA